MSINRTVLKFNINCNKHVLNSVNNLNDESYTGCPSKYKINLPMNELVKGVRYF